MAEIVKLRVDRGVRQSAQERHDALHLRIAPAVSLCEMQGRVVILGACWCEFHSPARKDAEKVQSRFRGEKRVSLQDLRSVESERTVAERFLEYERRDKRNASQPRLVFRIPVFERGFQVAFQKVDGGKEFARVRVLRVEPKRCVQAVLRSAKILLLVSDAGQFDEEARIPRCFTEA